MGKCTLNQGDGTRLISEAPALTESKKTKKTLIHIKKMPLLDDTHDVACLSIMRAIMKHQGDRMRVVCIDLYCPISARRVRRGRGVGQGWCT